MPIFPIHGWLPLAHVEAPSPVSILLSGILLKMGSYGLLRAVVLLPDAALALQGVLLGIALISLLYGGLLAWRQTDLKAMIAYSSISHMGVVLVGIAALNVTGFTGAVMQMVAHGLVAGALFLLHGRTARGGGGWIWSVWRLLYTAVHPDKPAQLFINEVGVAEAYQGQGVGSRLISELLALGRRLGCTEAWVATEPDNKAARRLYEKAGGQQDSSPFVMYTFPLLKP